MYFVSYADISSTNRLKMFKKSFEISYVIKILKKSHFRSFFGINISIFDNIMKCGITLLTPSKRVRENINIYAYYLKLSWGFEFKLS